MPVMKIKSPDGRNIQIKINEGENPPTEQELEEIFSNLPNDNKNLLQGNVKKTNFINGASAFGKGLIQGTASLGVGIGKNISNKIRPVFGKKSLTDEELNKSYGFLDDIPKTKSGKTGKFLGEIAPYFLLPEINALKGTEFLPKLGNMAITSGYQGGIIGGADSLMKEGNLSGVAPGTATGLGLGIGLPLLYKGGLKAVPWIAERAGVAFGGITPQTLRQSVKPNSNALELNAETAENLLMNTTERVRNSYNNLLNKRGENVQKSAEKLRGVEYRVPVSKLKEDIISTFNQYGGDLINPARNTTGKLENNLINLVEQGTPKSELEKLLHQVEIANNSNNKVDLTNVSEALKKFAGDNGVNLNNFTHNIDISAVNHIKKKHGNFNNENLRGQLPITNDDFHLIPEIVQKPDSVNFIGKNKIGRDLIKYTKQMPDSLTSYIEEIRTGKKRLTGQTMYKNGGRTAANAASPTSETTSANNIIPYDDPFFNSVSPIDLQKAKENIGSLIEWGNPSGIEKKFKNPILEQIYGKFEHKLSDLSPELSKANAEYSALKEFQKNEGLRRILRNGDNIDSASQALRNYNSTVTKGNTNRNIQELEKVLTNEGELPFLNDIDDVNAAMDLVNSRPTGRNFMGATDLIKSLAVIPSLKGIRAFKSSGLPTKINSIGKNIPKNLVPVLYGGAKSFDY